MKVLYDHQAFVLQRWGGISRYFLELITRVAATEEVELALARSMNEHVPALERLLGMSVGDRGFAETFLAGARFPGKKQLRSVVKRLNRSFDAAHVNRRASLERIGAGAFDLLHPTYYDPYFLDALDGRPYVLTVFDMTHEVLAEHFARDDVLPEWKRRAVRGAARLLAISENTKRDLVRLLGVDPGVVDVTHLGFAPPPADAAPPPPGLPERFVLFTGTRASYKNWAGCLRGLAPLLRDGRGLRLVCTGEPFTPAERALLDAERVADRVQHVAAGADELPAIYARAAVFVFPSLYEGFGLPLLEAFSSGCPVAAAQASSLPEVGGDAALYFDPHCPEAIGAAVDRLLGDAPLRDDLVARGRARVRTFTWQRTCDATLETYRRAAA